MADNLTSEQGNVYVEFDYNNLIVVDPNKKVDSKGNVSERLVDHENLVMYANLDAKIIPRTKLSIGDSPQNDATLVQVASIDFLKGNKGNYLTNQYYDEFTGKNSLSSEGINQPKEEIVTKNNKNYYKNTVVEPSDVVDNGLLGITSINITTNSSFTPVVTMSLEDVQGRALFQLGDNSPYAAFFNLPYCIFYLTLKGYYGKAIRYQLNLETFNAKYNSYSGNYTVDLRFKGYKFNILNEISMGHLLATPHMYSKTFNVSRTLAEGQSNVFNTTVDSETSTGVTNRESTNSNEELSFPVVTEKGYQKIVEVYSEYKSKNLIPQDFPELTIVQLMNKLEMFERNILNSYTKVNVDPLTNIRNYKRTLTDYYNRVINSSNSWFNTYLDNRPFITKNNEKVFAFKTLEPAVKENAKVKLKTIITDNNVILSENPTLGVRGESPIQNTIKYDMIEKVFSFDEIDWEKTAAERSGNISPTSDEINEIISEYTKSFKIVVNYDENNQIIPSIELQTNRTFFVFEGQNRFDSEIRRIEALANKKLSDYEDKITKELLEKLEDSETGIGFKPTVRNMIAVIMASTEAFIRLMDNVHTDAWNLKYDEIRKSAFSEISTSAPNSDSINELKIAVNASQDLVNTKVPVYPWPQFFVETPEDKKGRFQIKYIADPSVVNLTKGYLYEKWPEVEFVEEYLRGLTQKFNPPLVPLPLGGDLSTPIVLINPIEFPNSYLAYINKEEIKFLYEIWERQFITGYYTGFVRLNDKQKDSIFTLNGEIESNNIIDRIGEGSPFLGKKLKELNLNSSNFENVLKNSSNNGTTKSYQDFIRDFFVNSYIRNITENSFSISNIDDLGRLPDNPTNSTILKNVLKGVGNNPMIVDTYPFSDSEWVNANMSSSNLSSGNQVYNTNKILTVYEPINSISNFENLYDYNNKRPVVSFNYLTPVNPLTTQNTYLSIESASLFDFYASRDNSKLIPTEGRVEYDVPSGNLPVSKTTSMLNTPYFINSILDGVSRAKQKETYPYVSASYLFLNSLPLSTLRERYQSIDQSNLDYISSTLKKFGALHKVPYVWVLKIGSIWHRYKYYKENNIDILDNVWNNFNYVDNYSPIQKDINQTYSFEVPSDNLTDPPNEYNIVLQEENDSNININVGFFPKVINDFNYFYNGYDLYTNYTDNEIQSTINDGLKVYNFSDSNVSATQNGKSLFLQTWSVLLKDNIAEASDDDVGCIPVDPVIDFRYFVVPSFGSYMNEIKSSCLDNSTNRDAVVNITNNSSVYNGSVRMLWASSNYGYFDSDQIIKPSPLDYPKKVLNGDGIQSNFDLRNSDNYTNIEEIFSVFEKTILDQMEKEFLNFSKSQTDAELGKPISGIDQSIVNTNDKFRNFQSLFKELMTINPKKNSVSDDEYFKSVLNEQFNIFSVTTKKLMEYDVILRYGNPTNFRRRIFTSFLSNDNNQIVTDPINFGSYIDNTLPNGVVSLSESKQSNPNAWKALELEVGFSTINNLEYSDSNSYITDFFIDNDIEFNENNIVLLSPLIKMYATSKLKNPQITSQEFKTNLLNYLNECENIQNNSIDNLMNRVRSNLPTQVEITEKKIPSVVTGEQSKVELYEVFKALNDKWIAGGDYQNKTLFEDILFLDRASRNIGDTILVDIFDVKRMLNENSLNEAMSVYTFIAGLLIKNNFTVMNLPAYINFYNVQDVDGVQTNPNVESSLDFADNMWGTFLDVDYRNSGPKMVCYFVGKPSQYLDLPNNNARFRNDGFEMRKLSENPLIEDIQNKSDWSLSNRCVGFTVDMGIRNQNVFQGFSVSQDAGVATSESINTILNMVNQSTGREVATQNVGLYNLYKQRTYKCSVVSLGNALLQPTMYFNLRHVPMFNGPYMIMEVSHNISPGTFETTFTGMRQGIYDLPSIDTFLQSMNKNLLTKVEEILRSRKQNTSDNNQENLPDSKKASNVVQVSDNTKAPQGSCDEVNDQFINFVNIDAVPTILTQQQLADAIMQKTSDSNLQKIIYALCYLRTFDKPGEKDGKFVSWNNNFATITLDNNYGASVSYFDPTYCCININSKSKSIANFDSVDNFLDFMVSRLENNVERILDIGLNQYYVCNWPVSTNKPSQEYFSKNRDLFESSLKVIEFSQISAKSVGINIGGDNETLCN